MDGDAGVACLDCHHPIDLHDMERCNEPGCFCTVWYRGLSGDLHDAYLDPDYPEDER